MRVIVKDVCFETYISRRDYRTNILDIGLQLSKKCDHAGVHMFICVFNNIYALGVYTIKQYNKVTGKYE